MAKRYPVGVENSAAPTVKSSSSAESTCGDGELSLQGEQAAASADDESVAYVFSPANVVFVEGDKDNDKEDDVSIGDRHLLTLVPRRRCKSWIFTMYDWACKNVQKLAHTPIGGGHSGSQIIDVF